VGIVFDVQRFKRSRFKGAQEVQAVQIAQTVQDVFGVPRIGGLSNED
jgi:hypothetical protein